MTIFDSLPFGSYIQAFLIVIITIFFGILLILFILSPLISPQKMQLNGCHVLITGGSSGIGKSIAAYAFRRGASCSLLARNIDKLAEAEKDILNLSPARGNQKILKISVDVSHDYKKVAEAVAKAEKELGPIHILVNCAGTSMSGRFDELPIEEFDHLMRLNYFGSVYTTRAVIPSMKQRGNGRIVFVSSAAGQIGVYGFTAYSASKFALRGLAESLQMEIKPHNIFVTIAFPPDTDTPGFANENQSKPEETRLISESVGLFSPDKVARNIMRDTLKGKFSSYMGIDGYMLSTVTAGMSPVTSIMEAVQQVLAMGLFRIVGLFYLDNFDRIVRNCKKRKETSGTGQQ